MKKVLVLCLIGVGCLYLAMCSDSDEDANGGGDGVEVLDEEYRDNDDDDDDVYNPNALATDSDPTSSDHKIQQTCDGVGATCVITNSDCREMRGIIDSENTCISGVCCIVEITSTDDDGVCDGNCITNTECNGSGYVGWEVVSNGTCGNGTVCCVESSTLVGQDAGPADAPADTGSGAAPAATPTDTGAPAATCSGTCVESAISCALEGGTTDTISACDAGLVCCI